MERYIRILAINEELLQDNCPIIFVKGALLKDNKEKKNVLQMQFKNVSYKKVKAVIVDVFCYDIWNKLTDTIEHSYLDLAVGGGESFGNKEAILLKDVTVRNFKFSIKNIFFDDGSVLKCSGTLEKVTFPAALEDLGELRAQFVREVDKLNHSVRCVVKPVQSKGFWRCTCGFLNYGDNLYCGNCKISRDKLFDCLDVQKLKENNKKYLEEKAKKEWEEEQKKIEEQKLAEEKRVEAEKRRKRKIINISKIIAILIGVGTVICSLMFFVIIPQREYFSGLRAMENEDYFNAYRIFYGLEGFRDSKEKSEYCAYQRAEKLFDTENYMLAVQYYKRAGYYNDSEQKMLEAEYQYVRNNLDNNNLTTYSYLEELIEAEYKDSQDIYKELYTLSINVIVNGEENEYTKSEDKLSVYEKWYWHIIIEGEKPNENNTYNFQFAVTFPDGSVRHGKFENVASGDVPTCSSGYNTYYSDRATGIAYFELYDESGNYLAGEQVEIIDPWDY